MCLFLFLGIKSSTWFSYVVFFFLIWAVMLLRHFPGLCFFTFLIFWHQRFDRRLQFSAVQQAALCLGQKEAQTLQELHGRHTRWGRGWGRGSEGFEHLSLFQEEVLNHAPERGAPVPGELLHQSRQPLVRSEETHKGLAHAMEPAAAPRAHERRAEVGSGSAHAFWIWIRVVVLVHAAEGAAAVELGQGRSRAALQGQSGHLDARFLCFGRLLGLWRLLHLCRCLDQDRSDNFTAWCWDFAKKTKACTAQKYPHQWGHGLKHE